MEKIIEGVGPIPQERVQSSTVEQSVDALDPQIQEDIVQHNKTLHVIKKNHAKKCLEMFAEIAELNDDHMKFYEQFGKCNKLGVHDDCTVGAKIAELLRPNVSTSKTAEVPQAQFIDKLVDVPVDMPRQVPAVQVAQKTAEIPQVQFIDSVVDASVVQQRQLPTAQKTMQNPRARFLDEVVGMPVLVQHKVPMVQRVQENGRGAADPIR